MNIRMLIRAYKQIEAEEVKQKQFDELEANPLNYGIIRDLVNTARAGIVVTINLKDGAKIVMESKDSFDKLQQQRSLEAF
jgi:hypothetical protein